MNILGVELDEKLDEAGFRHSATAVGERLGARLIGAGVYEAEEGLPIWPYHYHHGVEEWLLVLAGTPALRRPDGEDRLEPGDVVCFPEGPDGAHQLLNRSGSAVRALLLSTTGVPANVCYPDTGEWRMHNV